MNVFKTTNVKPTHTEWMEYSSYDGVKALKTGYLVNTSRGEVVEVISPLQIEFDHLGRLRMTYQVWNQGRVELYQDAELEPHGWDWSLPPEDTESGEDTQDWRDLGHV